MFRFKRKATSRESKGPIVQTWHTCGHTPDQYRPAGFEDDCCGFGRPITR